MKTAIAVAMIGLLATSMMITLPTASAAAPEVGCALRSEDQQGNTTYSGCVHVAYLNNGQSCDSLCFEILQQAALICISGVLPVVDQCYVPIDS